MRGRGLLQGVVVDHDRPAIRRAALDLGLLITQAGANVLRVSPPLITGASHIDEAVTILREVLS